MSSIAHEIAKLSNPEPHAEDPENDINVETAAKLSAKFEEDEDITAEVSSLRLKNAPLLHEIDDRYAGKKISRKSLDNSYAESSSEPTSEDESDASSFDDDEETIDLFKQKINEKLPQENNERQPNADEFSESDISGSNEETGVEAAEDSEDDFVQRFSQIDVQEEVEKGKAVKKQQELWGKLCEWRIKLQRLLVVANRLPPYNLWEQFKEKADESYVDNLNKGHKSVCRLLNDLLEVQDMLLKCNPEMIGTEGNVENASDEEIPSGSEDEAVNIQLSQRDIAKSKQKRKNDMDHYEELLSKRHKSIIPFRNMVIQKWDEKTRFLSGRLTQKSFNMFDQTTLKQINQILQDKTRLIRRTQLKRSIYQVLGEQETAEQDDSCTDEKKVDPKLDLKNYHPEIFDDDDFYKQLLKDVIDSKSGIIDPLVFSKHVEIQRARSKKKRKVDTKASKGRKIRFLDHPKLLSQFAPMFGEEMPVDTRQELFASVFGTSHTVSVT